MEDRHDESQSTTPSSNDTRPSDAAVGSAATPSGSVSEETLEYLRKRVEDATQEEGASPSEDADAAAGADTEAAADSPIVLGPMTLGSLAEWQRLEARLRAALEGDAPASEARLVVECGAVSGVDSLAMGRLVKLHDLAQDKGRKVALVGVQRDVHTALAMMGLDQLLPCYADMKALENAEPMPALQATPTAEQNPGEADGNESAANGQEPSAAADSKAHPEESDDDATQTATIPADAPTKMLDTTEAFPIGALVEAVRGDLRTMYDALVGEMRGRFREVEQIRTNFNNLGKALTQVQGFLGEVATRLTAFEQHLNRLTGYFNERFRNDKSSQTAFDRLHEEMKFYRDDALFRSQKPVYMDLILLYDDVGRMLRDATDDDAANKFALLREVILEILYRRDVEVIEERPAKFDKSFQKALKRVITEERELDRTVAEVVRDGFRWGESVLRPQEVVVRRYEGDDAESESDAADAPASDTGHPGDEPPETATADDNETNAQDQPDAVAAAEQQPRDNDEESPSPDNNGEAGGPAQADAAPNDAADNDSQVKPDEGESGKPD